MERELRILQIEDVPTDAELEIRELKRAGLRVVHRLVDTEAAYREALREFQPDLILSDFSMPHFDGMWALSIARELAPDIPFIFVSGTIGEEYAIRALKEGATDYVLKGNLVRLPPVVERALQDKEAQAARRRAEEEIARQRAFLRQVIDLDRNRIFAKDRDGRFTLANQVTADAHGTTVEGLIGKTNAELTGDTELAERLLKTDREVLDSGRQVFIPEMQMADRAGNVRWFQVFKRPIASADGTAEWVLSIATDITERKGQELKIARLNRIHEVLSGINSAIVRIRERQQLFNEACRIAVEHGGLGMAFVSQFDPATLDVVPIAHAGIGSGDFADSKTTARADMPLGQGVVGRAIRSKAPVAVNDLTADPDVGSAKRREAIRRGYRSVVALPLLVHGGVFGTITLYAKEAGFFDDDELKLLTELAADVSFALEHIAGQEKIEKLSRLRAVSSEINAAIVRTHDHEQLLRDTWRIAVDHGKFDLIWIGAIDSGKQEIRPLFWNGFSDGAANAVTWQAVRDAKGTLGEALQTRRTAVRNDVEAQYSKGRLRAEAMERGCLSNVCLPLVAHGSVVGLIALFAPGRGYFDKDELTLLEEVASNVSFALEHIAAQRRIEKLSRVRAVSGEINAAIVRIRNREELFSEACRIAVEHGKFVMAWIGLLDEAGKEIRPVAEAGREDGYLERIKLTIDPDTTRNLAMAVEAVGRHMPVVCNDIANDGRMRPWRTAALERGYRANAMLPLLVGQRTAGVFALYAPESGFFDEEEMKLLVEMAGDVSFALDHIEKAEKLNYLAYYDQLTGLPNRTLFNDRLDQRISAARDRKQTFSMMLFDIERFRLVNDTLGRLAGDDLLRQVSQRLKNTVQNVDLLAHFNGDLFAIATRRTEDPAIIIHILEEILTSFSLEPYRVSGNELRVAARAGVAMFPADGSDVESLLRNAEAALKKAKSLGERYLFYAPQMNARVVEQMKLENDLRNALRLEQYVLYYQPRFDFASGRITGLEALIRWKHPERGMVSPAEFIPILEETGMIVEVGRWALRRAALDHAGWSGSGLQPPRVAVNVSPAQLRRRDFVDYVKDALAAVDGAADRLDVEITESMLMEDMEGSIAKLAAVRAMGLHVALDDFGTGYSSLSYLARLPINALKIDRSFVMQMNKSPEQMAIVSTVISLGRALNLKVVSEGVETEEQANLLRLLRCDEAQGYLFGRPMPPDQIEALLVKK